MMTQSRLFLLAFASALSSVGDARLTVQQSNGTVLLSVPTVHFVLGNDSFAVLARGYLVADVNQATYSYPADSAGHVLFVQREISWNYAAQADECIRVGCQGVVVTGQSDTSGYVDTWTYRTDRVPFTSVPIVAIPHYPDDPWFARIKALLAADPSLLVYIDSDDVNPFGVAMHLPFVTFSFALGGLMNAFLILYASVKVLAFAVDDRWTFRAIPVLALTVLSTQIAASAIRLLACVNWSICRGQCLVPIWVRLYETVFFPFHYATTMAMAWNMYDMSRIVHATSRCQDALVRALMIGIVCVCAFDAYNTVSAAVAQKETLATSAVVLVYVLITLPISILFIVNGARVSRFLMDSSRQHADLRKVALARRTAISGVVGIGCFVTLVLALVFDLLALAPSTMYTNVGFAMFFNTLEGIMFVAAFVQPASAVSFASRFRKTTVAITPQP
ncbi:Uncharacterized protein PBTT_10176 [Plasmodiophora brassicae]